MSKYIPWAVLLLAIVYIIYQRTNPITVVEQRETIVIDSTTIDSLKSRISYLEDLPPVVVTDTIEIPVPVEVDGVYTYKFPYRDSVLTAALTLSVLGEVEFTKAVFDYRLKQQRLVVENTERIVLTKYRTRTIEKVINQTPKGYFTVGGEAGIDNLSLTGGWMTPKNYHIQYRYNTQTGTHNIGVAIPLKL